MTTPQQGSFKLTAEQLQADTAYWQSQPVETALRTKPFNQVMKDAEQQPIPHMLFGEFWFEGELCILFSDSNTGKSILAVQIGNSICKGESMQPFKLEAGGQTVLYCDFELTAKQLEARYTQNWTEHYQFADNFFRADLNPDADMPDGIEYEEYLNLSIERAIVETGARVIIIDNITYIGTENEQAKFALPLMKHLKSLKNDYDLSILVLAHTPKRDRSKPITGVDLQGSRMLMNFCDSSFAIGASNVHPDRRYLKQMKQRNTQQAYGDDNVRVFDIAKPHNFLQYNFVGYSDERRHLRAPKDHADEENTEKALELRSQGLSLRQIASQLGIDFNKVNRLLKTAGGK